MRWASRAIITSSSDEKLARAKALGAACGINYKTTPEWDKAAIELTGGRGVDQVLEVGGAGTLTRSFGAIRVGGKISIIGGLSGGATELNPGLIFSKRANVQGIYVGSTQMFEAMNAAIAANKIKPAIDRVFGFDEVKAAFITWRPARISAKSSSASPERITKHARIAIARRPASAGNATSTSVPAFGALLMVKLARLASASALVSGRPRPVPPEPQLPDVAVCRNGSSAASMSFSLMPTPVSRTRSTASPLSANAVDTITWPPGPVNLIEFDSRLSTIWRSERSSATTCGSPGVSEVRMMMRARFACGCMMPTHCCVRSLRLTLAKVEIELAGLDLGKIEQIVEQRDEMRAGGMDVFEIFAVAVVADRTEALRHDHLGEPGDGVERRADLVADLGEEFRFRGRRLLRFALGGAQFILSLLSGSIVRSSSRISSLSGGQRRRCRALALLGFAVGQDERQRRGSVPGHREQPALDRNALAAAGHDRQRLRAVAFGQRAGAPARRTGRSGRPRRRAPRGSRNRSIRGNGDWRKAGASWR